jgi:hypothetical protein
MRTSTSDASVHVVPELKQLLSQPDALHSDAVLYAIRPWTAETDAVVLVGDDAPAGYEYLLEVDLVLDVLEVWSAWRGGQSPTPEEAAKAVIYYAERDAYLQVT